MAESKRESIGKIKIDLDVSDAITGLKAVQREAKAATKALAEFQDLAERLGEKPLADGWEMARSLRSIFGKVDSEDKYEEYIDNVKKIAGDRYSDDFSLTNELIYQAYHLGKGCELLVRRHSGTSTSLIALGDTFNDVEYLQRGDRNYTPDLDGKVVFVDPGVSVPEDCQIKRIYRIVSVDEHEFQSKMTGMGVTHTSATIAR